MKITYEEYLNTHDRLCYTQVGVSMLPLLRQGKDMFIVQKKPDGRCRTGDVVLYRRPPSHYVLHRIIQVRGTDYVCLGDNSVLREPGIRDEDIIGVMTGYIRGGKEHSVQERGYRLYSFIRLHTVGPRIRTKRLASAAKRWIRSWHHE